MLEALAASTRTCEATDCDRPLPDEPSIVFETPAGRQCAYECPCGAVTITVARSESTP